MANYHAYYWFNPTTGQSKSICEPLDADTMDGASQMVQQRLQTPSFFFDSAKEGRVIVVSSHIQYVEIEEEGCGDERHLPDGMMGGAHTEDIVELLNKGV